MTRIRIAGRRFYWILNLLFLFQSIAVFSQDMSDAATELEKYYRIIRTGNNVKIVHADGSENENWYMLELGKNVPDSLSIDRENSRLLKHALQKYKFDNSALMDTIRKNFSDDVDLAYISFIISKSGRFEYLYIFLKGNRKNLTSEYSDDKYYDFFQWLSGNIEITPWDFPLPYCRGAFRVRSRQ